MEPPADWRQGIDYGRLRRDRLERVRASMDAHELDAILVFRPENTRYTGSLRPLWMPTWLYLNAAIVVAGAPDPIVWVMSDDYPHRASVMTWLPEGNVRRFPGAIEDSADASESLAPIASGLRELGFEVGRLGIDMASVNVLDQLHHLLPDAEIVDGEWPMRSARAIKTADEVALMREGCRAVDAAFEAVFASVRPGVRETDVLGEAYRELFRLGAEFPQSAGIVASGPHSAPMARFATDRIMQNGDIVWVDVGGCFSGIFCEASRAIAVGNPNPEQQRIHSVAYRTQQAVFGTIGSGITATQVQAAARSVLEEAELLEFLQTGPLLHGIGVSSAEPPWVPGPEHEYNLTFEAGMTFSVVPTLQVTTVDGGGGVRLEDQIVVTDSGCERLTRARYDDRLFDDTVEG